MPSSLQQPDDIIAALIASMDVECKLHPTHSKQILNLFLLIRMKVKTTLLL